MGALVSTGPTGDIRKTESGRSLKRPFLGDLPLISQVRVDSFVAFLFLNVGGFTVLRIPAVIAVIMLIGAIILSAQAQAAPKCYDPQKCDAECQKASSVGKSCKKMCDHQQATLPACK
jgi:hypothetical protein